VKDAQRHGLKVKPIDAACSDWLCTLEKLPRADNQADNQKDRERFALRLGLRYAKGLHERVGREIVSQRAIRPFSSIDDLKLRVPEIQKSELTALAEIGALNSIAGKRSHRRDALWQIERVARRAGPLLETPKESKSDPRGESEINSPVTAVANSPLAAMTPEERLVADFRGTGMTVGPHPLAYHRAELRQQGIRAAVDLAKIPDGTFVRVAGAVIARQRPGTAKGFVFLSLEDETGIANAIITPQIFAQDHITVVHHSLLLIEGRLQNLDNVISVKVERVLPLSFTRAEIASHDFH
jgi:error-prone DNA polymerase